MRFPLSGQTVDEQQNAGDDQGGGPGHEERHPDAQRCRADDGFDHHTLPATSTVFVVAAHRASVTAYSGEI